MVALKIVLLYNGAKLIRMLSKSCFHFWILSFSQASDIWCDILKVMGSASEWQLPVSHAIRGINHSYCVAELGWPVGLVC